MAIIRPRFIAIDSSVLGALIRDANGAHGAERTAASEIINRIHDGRLLPTLTLTLMSELLQHDDDRIVAARLDALAAIPNLAYVKSFQHPSQAGSIIDVGAAEVDAVFIRRLKKPSAIAEHAKKTFLSLAKGRDLMLPYRAVLPELRRRLSESRKEARILSSLVHADVLKNRNQTLRVALRDSIGFRKDVEAATADLAEKWASALDSQGDKKMQNRREVGKRFIAAQAPTFKSLAKSKLSVLETMCANAHVDIRAVSLDMTVEEFCWMPVYQRHLHIFSEVLGLPTKLTEFDVPSGLLPHWIVRREIFHARRGAARAAGSDLGDDHLAALACYADLTIVDKRTYAYLGQGLKRSACLRECLRPIARVRSTSDLAEKLLKTR
jgi:hypothetical protein